MKKIIFSVLAVCCLFITATGQTGINEISVIENLDTVQKQTESDKKLQQLKTDLLKIRNIQDSIRTITDEIAVIKRNLDNNQSKQTELDKTSHQLSTDLKRSKRNIQKLEQYDKDLCKKTDGLQTFCDSLANSLDMFRAEQSSEKDTVYRKIDDTNSSLSESQTILQNRTLWGGGIAIIIVAALITTLIVLLKKIGRGRTSIEKVKEAQQAMEEAQKKMQETSIDLDQKLVDLMRRQMENVFATSTKTAPDHSLALKVADEIVCIELNLSRMDASIRGYKQLMKAVQRIKNNFTANGYEIVDMLGKPYNEGMRVIANFVLDEKLKDGEQIITGITKPQINYNGKMIQSAQITVSQNI